MENTQNLRGRENVGTLDAYIRLTGGLLLLTLGATGKLGRVGSPIAWVLGASKVAEGISRYCPINDLLGVSTVEGRGSPREAVQSVDDVIEKSSPAPRDFPWERAERERKTLSAPVSPRT